MIDLTQNLDSIFVLDYYMFVTGHNIAFIFKFISKYQLVLCSYDNKLNYVKEDENKIDELRNKLFGEKFHFQTLIKNAKKPWIFNLFTFVTDFYMSQSDIHLAE